MQGWRNLPGAGMRTQDLLNKWMKDYKDDHQKILEQIATEQLLGKMTREIQIYVRERKPESAMQTGGLAEDYNIHMQRLAR